MSATRLGLRRVVQALAGALLAPGVLRAWRVVAPWRDPLDASGSLAYVGRWHSPKTGAALYAAELLDTAIAEVAAHLSSGRHNFVAALLEIHAPAVFDLTVPQVAQRLPFSVGRCMADTRLSRFRGAIVGDAARAIGATALVAPCLRGPGVCVCVFGPAPNRLTVVETRPMDVSVD